MYEKELLQKIVAFVNARRTSWKFMLEDNLIRLLTQQYVVNWKIIDEVQEKYKLELIDVTAHQSGLVISFRIPDVSSIQDVK